MSMICEVFTVSAQQAQELAAEPSGIHDLLTQLEQTCNALSLEKSWHGLHFVLTGTAWEGDAPLSFIARGGELVGDEDVGYGPARVLSPVETQALNAALSDFTEADFARNFVPERLAAEEIYPQIWDEPLDDLKEEYTFYLQELKTHVKRAAESGEGLLVTIR